MTRKSLWTFCCALLLETGFALPSAPASASDAWETTRLPDLESPKKCHKGDPTRCVIYLRKGEVAPFSGPLSSPTQAATLGVRADPKRVQKRIDEAVKTAKDVAAKDLELEREKHAINVKALEDKLAATEANHELQLDAVKPSWYEHPLVVGIVAVGLTLAIIEVADRD